MSNQAEPSRDQDNVLPLRVAREITRETARDIEALFPGWRVQYEAGPGRWFAQRKGNFRQIPGDERACTAAAGDVMSLVTMLERQMRLDIAMEFPDWEITQAGTGNWRAVSQDAAGDKGSRMVARVVCHPTIAGLHAALRELLKLNSQGYPIQPC
jgi:hypothetical protein